MLHVLSSMFQGIALSSGLLKLSLYIFSTNKDGSLTCNI